MPELGRLTVESSTLQNTQQQDKPKPQEHPKNQATATTTVPATDEASFPALPKPKSSTSSSSKAVVPKASISQSEPKTPVRPSKFENKLSAVATEALSKTSQKEPDTQVPIPQPTRRHPSPDNVSKASSTAAPGSVESQASTSSKNRRQHPGKLDISAAKEAAQRNVDLSSEALPGSGQADSPGRSVSEQPSGTPSVSSRSGTPAPSDATSRRFTQPRTLRVLATPKTDTPPLASSTSSSTPSVPALARAGPRSNGPSRQASITSATVPETPASERAIPDTPSVTTESLSRAGSPPPTLNKVGSAPVRAKTKSQQKKERKERAKEEEPEVDPEPTPQPDVVQEPILGRKTKARKPKVAQPPKPSRVVSTEKKQMSEKAEMPEKEEKPEGTTPIVESKASTPNQVEEMKPIEQEDKKQPNFVNNIVESLQNSGEVSQELLQKLFNSTNFSPKSFAAGDMKTASPMAPLTLQEMSQLKSGKPVRRHADGTKYKADREPPVADRLLITPNSHLCIRGLPKDLEDRLIELDGRVSKSKPPRKYSHRASTPAAAAAGKLVDELLKEMTKALTQVENVVNAQLQSQQSSGHDRANPNETNEARPPVYADDALAYLNQYILPLSPSWGGNGVIPTMNVGGRQYAPDSTAGRTSADPVNATSSYTATEGTGPNVSSALPRTYTTGDPTYSVSGVDVPPSGIPQGSPSTVSPATPNTLSSQSQATNPAANLPNLNLKPLTDLAAHLPPLAASYSSQIDALAGHAARDALAASLGAASSTLASVASDAAAAVSNAHAARNNSNAPSSSSNPALWQTRGFEALNLEHDFKDLKGLPSLSNLPQDVMSLGAEAIRQALLGAAPHLTPAGSPNGQVSASGGYTAPARSGAAGGAGSRQGRSSGGSSANRTGDLDDAHKIMLELEAALALGRKELEGVEKRLSGVAKKNRKAVGV